MRAQPGDLELVIIGAAAMVALPLWYMAILGTIKLFLKK